MCQVIEAQPDMPLVDAVGLHVSLLTFTLRVHVDRLDYVDQVLVWTLSIPIFETKVKIHSDILTESIFSIGHFRAHVSKSWKVLAKSRTVRQPNRLLPS